MLASGTEASLVGKAVMRHAIHSAVVLLLLSIAPMSAQAPIVYRLSFPAPEHHYAEVEVTFPDLPDGRIELRMSRSSPGRYALHEYSKNVFGVRVYDGAGRELRVVRPNAYQWDVTGHDGTVRVTYKVFGNLVDGTYLAIDTSHAHLNMPATLMWARRLDMRPVRITFAPPKGYSWKPATQLFETEDPWTFAAPNLQYLMDSPTELSDYTLRTFKVRNPDGKEFTIRAAVHHDATDADVNEYVTAAEKIVIEQGAVFGEYPEFDGGTYTFLGDYLPWGGGDGMEHRNSTVVAAKLSIRGNVRRVLGTVSHEFFHAWNVERIRPLSLEPFDFEEANMSGELWLAEGFTTYYGGLIMARAGLSAPEQTLTSLANSALAVATSPGHQFRSAVEMSQLAPFSDAARSVDPTNFSYAFINYYPFGSAIALALDLELRQRSKGSVTLDDFMRAMWRIHGKPGGPQPGFVARPYTLQDARARLAEVSGDRAFADQFFARFIEGREVPDYAALLAPAGVVVRKRHAGVGWSGAEIDAAGKVAELVAWGTPAFDAGLEEGDVIASVDGKPFDGFKARKPGDRVVLAVSRPTGKKVSLTMTLGEDPGLEAVPSERAGGTLTSEQKAFRENWLGSKARQPVGVGRR
jgi:predicted metalloprotease with PDZ domain